MEVGVRERRCIEHNAMPGQNVWGGHYLFIWAGELINEKEKKNMSWPSMAAIQNIFTQQPTKNIRPRSIRVQRRGANGEEWGGSAIPSILGAIELGVDKKLK
jgi:hypothetical protein